MCILNSLCFKSLQVLLCTCTIALQTAVAFRPWRGVEVNHGSPLSAGTQLRNMNGSVSTVSQSGQGLVVGLQPGLHCHHPTFHETCVSCFSFPSNRVVSCSSSRVPLKRACNSNICFSFGSLCFFGNVLLTFRIQLLSGRHDGLYNRIQNSNKVNKDMSTAITPSIQVTVVERCRC